MESFALIVFLVKVTFAVGSAAIVLSFIAAMITKS
jgi:hypothetical protein